MNKQQRKQWDEWIDKFINYPYRLPEEELVLEANKHILKLERELQNIKGQKKVSAILLNTKKED